MKKEEYQQRKNIQDVFLSVLKKERIQTEEKDENKKIEKYLQELETQLT